MPQTLKQRQQEISAAATCTKPPPYPPKIQSQCRLFQSLDELHIRQGDAPTAKDRLTVWGGGLLIGLFVFSVLYLLIYFLER